MRCACGSLVHYIWDQVGRMRLVTWSKALVLSPDWARTVCLTWNKTTPLLAKYGRQNNGPQTYHILIPDLWVICGKKGILQRWLRILSWGDDPGLSRWPNTVTRVLMSEKGRQRVREDVITKAEVGVVPSLSGGWEPRNAGSFQKLEKKRGQILLWGLRKEPALTLLQWDPFWTSNLQKYKIINVSCFKPLSLR